MALKSFSDTLVAGDGTVNTTVLYTCPVGTEASIHGLVFSNNTAAATTYTMWYYKAAVNTRYLLAELFPIAARKAISWPKPINMQPGDYIEAVSATADAVEATASVYEGATTSQGFNLAGTWQVGNTYYINDVVTLNGSSYAAIQSSIGQDPVTSVGYWLVLAQRGDTGPMYGSRVVGYPSGTSVTIDADITDMAVVSNTTASGTFTIGAPTGTPVSGQKIMLRLQTTNTQTLSWNAAFVGSADLPLPTNSTGSSKYDYMGFIYNSTAANWQIIAKNFGF